MVLSVRSIVGIAMLPLLISCTAGKMSQAEAKAAQAEKSAVELAAKLSASNNDLAKLADRVAGLEAKTNAAEERAKKAEGALAAAKIDKIKEEVAKEAPAKNPPAAEKVAAVKSSEADAIRVHSLAAEDQIAKESEEIAPALKACDKEGKLGLAICVLPKQTQYSSWLPVLVTWNQGAITTEAEAKTLLGCLQGQSAVKRDKAKTNKNAAEFVVRSSFTGECIRS